MYKLYVGIICSGDLIITNDFLVEATLMCCNVVDNFNGNVVHIKCQQVAEGQWVILCSYKFLKRAFT